MLYYVPLEPYKERYTWQLSHPVTGWMERKWREVGIEYRRIGGVRDGKVGIEKGVVLDAVGRSRWSFSQVEQLLELTDRGEIKSEDCIYFEDFWTPGVEALPYLFDQIGVHPRMYSMLWAQSVDEFDFTAGMKYWIRPIEQGYGKIYDGIFVGHPLLKELVVQGGIAPESKVFVVGLPFCTEEVNERMPWREGAWEMERLQKVVYSSRWDTEKDPLFFLKVVSKVLEQRPDTKFVVCTGSKKVRSNDLALVEKLDEAVEVHKGQLQVHTNCTKEEYYSELCTARVQINTALQDFVAFTLLEASVAGAYPLYPYFRSFPLTFRRDRRFLYERQDVEDCTRKVCCALDRDDLWTRDAIQNRAWIHNRFDLTWKRQLAVMGLVEGWYDEPM